MEEKAIIPEDVKSPDKSKIDHQNSNIEPGSVDRLYERKNLFSPKKQNETIKEKDEENFNEAEVISKFELKSVHKEKGQILTKTETKQTFEKTIPLKKENKSPTKEMKNGDLFDTYRVKTIASNASDLKTRGKYLFKTCQRKIKGFYNSTEFREK